MGQLGGAPFGDDSRGGRLRIWSEVFLARSRVESMGSAVERKLAIDKAERLQAKLAGLGDVSDEICSYLRRSDGHCIVSCSRVDDARRYDALCRSWLRDLI